MYVKYKNRFPVTYQLHTLSPKWHIPFIVPALVLRLLLLDFSCNQSILYNTWCHRVVLFVYSRAFPKCEIGHLVIGDVLQTGMLITSVYTFLPIKVGIFAISKQCNSSRMPSWTRNWRILSRGRLSVMSQSTETSNRDRRLFLNSTQQRTVIRFLFRSCSIRTIPSMTQSKKNSADECNAGKRSEGRDCKCLSFGTPCKLLGHSFQCSIVKDCNKKLRNSLFLHLIR